MLKITSGLAPWYTNQLNSKNYRLNLSCAQLFLNFESCIVMLFVWNKRSIWNKRIRNVFFFCIILNSLSFTYQNGLTTCKRNNTMSSVELVIINIIYTFESYLKCLLEIIEIIFFGRLKTAENSPTTTNSSNSHSKNDIVRIKMFLLIISFFRYLL